MRPSAAFALPLCLVLAAAAPAAFAVQSCELNGAHVNPNNGNTTEGKSGLMRCAMSDNVFDRTTDHQHRRKGLP